MRFYYSAFGKRIIPLTWFTFYCYYSKVKAVIGIEETA